MRVARGDLIDQSRLRNLAIIRFVAQGLDESPSYVVPRAGAGRGIVRHGFGPEEASWADNDDIIPECCRTLKQRSLLAASEQLFARPSLSGETGFLPVKLLRSVREATDGAHKFFQCLAAEPPGPAREPMSRGNIVHIPETASRVFSQFGTCQSRRLAGWPCAGMSC